MSKRDAAILEKVVEAGGRLLRVERVPASGAAGARVSERLRLAFDVGVVELRATAGPGSGARGGADAGPALVAEVVPVEQAGDLASEALPVDAAEEEPWWALLGHPLARVSAREDGTLLVQFRGDEESPRIFVLAAERGGVAVRPLV